VPSTAAHENGGKLGVQPVPGARPADAIEHVSVNVSVRDAPDAGLPT